MFLLLEASHIGRYLAQPRGEAQDQMLDQLATDGAGYATLILLWKMLECLSSCAEITKEEEATFSKFVLFGGTFHLLFMFVILASSSYVEISPSAEQQVEGSVAGFTMCIRIFEELVRCSSPPSSLGRATPSHLVLGVARLDM